MKRTRNTTLAALLLPVLIASGQVFAAPAKVPDNFADEAFKNVWLRTDSLVDNGSVKRSYFWGPVPGFTAYEEYAEGEHGKHLVQYFDKSRMEINNPSGDKTNPFYVTNGLLTQELIYGRIQTGNTRFEQRYPAEIDIASDGDDTAPGTPTYASFLYQANVPAIDRAGETIDATIDRAGHVGIDSTFTNYNVRYTHYESATQHNIPDVFWSFLNMTGPVVQNGKTVSAKLNDPYFYATGYPIAEAYWARVKIAGIADTAVLIQPYERRVLTYVPTAPEGFKVQMGNIGQHYYAWRYSDAGKPVTTPQPVSTPAPLVCGNLPKRGFGKVWGDHEDVKAKLGCPNSLEDARTVIQQYFEHGQIVEVIYTAQGKRFDGTIYVMFEDGTTQIFKDDYVNGTPEPNIVAPTGLYVPVRGIGKVWREQTAAKIQERLGFATAPETDAVSDLHPIAAVPNPSPGQGGAVLFFDKGLMVYAGPTLRKIYVLYNTTAPPDVDHWLVFDDTYREP